MTRQMNWIDRLIYCGLPNAMLRDQTHETLNNDLITTLVVERFLCRPQRQPNLMRILSFGSLETALTELKSDRGCKAVLFRGRVRRDVATGRSSI
jgi:hypothetical protein